MGPVDGRGRELGLGRSEGSGLWQEKTESGGQGDLRDQACARERRRVQAGVVRRMGLVDGRGREPGPGRSEGCGQRRREAESGGQGVLRDAACGRERRRVGAEEI
jgi:hypothetical protein